MGRFIPCVKLKPIYMWPCTTGADVLLPRRISSNDSQADMKKRRSPERPPPNKTHGYGVTPRLCTVWFNASDLAAVMNARSRFSGGTLRMRCSTLALISGFSSTQATIS